MKKQKNLKKWGMDRLIALVLAFALLACAFNPLQVEAKTKKINLILHGDYSSDISAVDPFATEVKKGTYTFVLKDNSRSIRRGGYIKFTAPKTKTYTFNVSNLKADNGKYENGYFHIYRTDYERDYIKKADMKTRYGKNKDVAFIENKGGSKEFPLSNYGKLKLQEGETVYVYFYFGGNKCKTISFKCSIK